MLLTSKGIVLQSFKYGENSLISKVISQEKGLVTLLSNKTKGKKNKLGNFFQPFTAIQFVCYLSNKSSIHRIKEISYSNSIPLAPESVPVNAIRFFLAEFLSKVIKEEEQNFSLYEFLEIKLLELNSSLQINPYFHIQFLIELMDILGIQPYLEVSHTYLDLEEGVGCTTKPSHPHFLEKSEVDLYRIGIIKPKILQKVERSKLLNALLNYYNVQLGGVGNIKSKAVLELVFS